MGIATHRETLATNDLGPLHDWPSLDQAGLRAYADTFVGMATNEMADPGDLDWTLEQAPLDLFDALAVEWDVWHREEVVPNPTCGWMTGDVTFHTPIVISIESGEPIIWDGWHRIAHAKARGDRTIHAIIGRDGAWA